MKKKLIVNADDYGYSRGINLGIMDAHLNGIVTSTTMLTTLDGFDHGCELAQKVPSLGIGVHLTVDVGRPVTGAENVPSMVDKNGVFRKHNFSELGLNINPDEVYKEWTAQVKKALDGGIKVTHLDSHHHAHMHRELFPTFVKVAQDFKLPIRFNGESMPVGYNDEINELVGDLRHPDVLAANFYLESATLKTIESHLNKDIEVVEIMCHPAYVDQAILKGSSYNTFRTQEIDILLSQEAKDLVNKYGYELISYKSL